MLPDRGQLPGEVGELIVVRDRPPGHQDVAGEHHAKFLAVQAHRAVGMARRVDDLKSDVGDLEGPAVLHFDVGGIAGMSLRHSFRSFGCSATGASSRSASSIAAAT